MRESRSGRRSHRRSSLFPRGTCSWRLRRSHDGGEGSESATRAEAGHEASKRLLRRRRTNKVRARSGDRCARAHAQRREAKMMHAQDQTRRLHRSPSPCLHRQEQVFRTGRGSFSRRSFLLLSRSTNGCPRSTRLTTSPTEPMIKPARSLRNLSI